MKICICIFMCIYIETDMHEYVCMSACMHLPSMHADMYVYIYVCVDVSQDE